MGVSNAERQINVSITHLVFLIIASAWVTVIIPLLIGMIRIPESLGGPSAGIVCLLATLAFTGACASWYYKRGGVYLYIAASIAMLGYSVFGPKGVTSTVLPMQTIVLLLAYLTVLIPSWPKFQGKNA